MKINIILCVFAFQVNLYAQNSTLFDTNLENKSIELSLNKNTTNDKTVFLNTKKTIAITNILVFETTVSKEYPNAILTSKNKDITISEKNIYPLKNLNISQKIVLEYSFIIKNQLVTNYIDKNDLWTESSLI